MSGQAAARRLLADPGLRAVWAVLPESRVVGGAVRDALDRRPVADVDLATPRRPEAVTAALGAAGIRVVPTGIDHGTVTAVMDGRGIEITTLRRDEETDGRHARVTYTDNWQEDAARRDFTINAMSLTSAGELFDYFGGRADLAAGRVRFVGDPATRIAEDYLRILRFFRFYARYGKGAPDVQAAAAIRAGVPGLALLSPERVWSELKRILLGDDALQLMDDLGVLAAVLPEGFDLSGLKRLAAGAPSDPLLRLAKILTGDPTRLAERLRLSVAERDQLISLHGPNPGPPAPTPTPTPTPMPSVPALNRLLADTEKKTLIDRTFIIGGAGEAAGPWDDLRARIDQLVSPVFPLAGRDVLALGVPPGPRVGALLGAVRQWWLQGGCVADADTCRAELARRVGG